MFKMMYDYDDVLIVPKPSKEGLTRGSVDIEINHRDGKCVPIIVANMLSTGTYEVAEAVSDENILVFLHKEYSADDHKKYLDTFDDVSRLAITSGVQHWDIDKTVEVMKYKPLGIINVDIANVYANVHGMVETIKHYRRLFPDTTIVAGNVCTPDLTNALFNAGADIVKVGVGAGAACKTRSEVGVGIPQFSAVKECAQVAMERGKRVIADGGCVTSGDVAKALGAGADFVMLGGMLSKCSECSNIVEVDGKEYVNFWGLGSTTQYNKYTPTENEYRPNEGRDLLVPVEGSMIDVIRQVKGGIRSACTYVGVGSLVDMKYNTDFVQVNNTINRSLEKYERK